MTADARNADFVLDFIVVGSRKCATTWLYECCAAHPEIRVSHLVKESGYFGRNHGKGLGWYRGLFPTDSAWRLTGEVDANLLRTPGAIGRIAAEFPKARVIAIFRHPADMFFSSFDHAVRKGDLSCDASTAWRDFPEFMAEVQFGSMVEALQAAFPPSQLCLVLYEDIERDAEAVLGRLGAFIGLNAPFPPAAAKARANVARSARIPFLAIWLSRAARAARAVGLHGIVQGLKRLPVAAALYRPKDRAAVRRERSGALRAQIMHELGPQVERFAALSGLPVAEAWAGRP